MAYRTQCPPSFQFTVAWVASWVFVLAAVWAIGIVFSSLHTAAISCDSLVPVAALSQCNKGVVAQ